MTKIEPAPHYGGQLTERQRAFLLTGSDPLEPDFDNEEEIRRAWQVHRGDLLEFWTQDPEGWTGTDTPFTPAPRGPGHRPEAWWRLEAPESRRQVIERIPQAEEDGRYQPPWEERDTHHGIPWSWYDALKVESSPAYLRRHGLLTEKEEAVLSDSTDAFTPIIEPEWRKDKFETGS